MDNVNENYDQPSFGQPTVRLFSFVGPKGKLYRIGRKSENDAPVLGNELALTKLRCTLDADTCIITCFEDFLTLHFIKTMKQNICELILFLSFCFMIIPLLENANVSNLFASNESHIHKT